LKGIRARVVAKVIAIGRVASKVTIVENTAGEPTGVLKCQLALVPVQSIGCASHMIMQAPLLLTPISPSPDISTLASRRHCFSVHTRTERGYFTVKFHAREIYMAVQAIESFAKYMQERHVFFGCENFVKLFRYAILCFCRMIINIFNLVIKHYAIH